MLSAVSPPGKVMAKDLRGFWNDKEVPARTMAQDRRAAAFKVRKKKAKRPKHRAPWKAAHKPAEDFFRSLKWKQLRYLALVNTGSRCQCCGASASDGALSTLTTLNRAARIRNWNCHWITSRFYARTATLGKDLGIQRTGD